MENFALFVSTNKESPQEAIGADFFQVWADLVNVNGRFGSEVFFQFLNKVFDRNTAEIDEYLSSFIKNLWNSKQLGRNGFNDGLNRFLTYMPTIIADYPKMNEWLAIVIHQLGELGALKNDTLCLNDKIARADYKPENDEDAPMVEDYYRLVARLLLLKANRQSPNELKQFFDKDTQFGRHFSKMKGLILEDDFFNKVEEGLKQTPDEDPVQRDQKAVVIRAILEQDVAKFEAAVGK